MPVDLKNDTVTLTHGDSEVTIYHFGASLTSWKYKGSERIFTSEKAIYTGPKAIRGGIPLVFPQFGPNGPLPQHGFARDEYMNMICVEVGSVQEPVKLLAGHVWKGSQTLIAL
jgi:glucose-6-phosphate 1-epimerase